MAPDTTDEDGSGETGALEALADVDMTVEVEFDARTYVALEEAAALTGGSVENVVSGLVSGNVNDLITRVEAQQQQQQQAALQAQMQEVEEQVGEGTDEG